MPSTQRQTFFLAGPNLPSIKSFPVCHIHIHTLTPHCSPFAL